MSKPKTVSQFIKDHLWEILMTTFMCGGAFLWLKAEMIGVQYRLLKVEAFQAEYPSKGWFILKFESEREYTDLKFQSLEKKIENCSL